MPMVAAFRQQADDEGRQAHDEDGDEEGVFAADDVADAAEHDGAERTNDEAGGEGQEREDVARGLCEHRLIVAGSMTPKNCAPMMRGERAEKIKVIPFENGAE